jgi:adenylate cyclase
MTGTRRLAAILSADVAGYSRLIGADEGGTLQALKAIRAELLDPAIAAHNGRLVKTTGDGLLVEFTSVVDALRCATEIQARMVERNASASMEKRIDFRIGIHQADIVVEDGDIFGDGVNVAARLEGLAEPGGICVSARVEEDAAGKLDLAFEDIGDQKLKNITRPVRVFRIIAGAPSLVTVAPVPLTLPDKPSVAVLPFTNMSADPEQEFFADGMAEDVITALARYPSLFVIARNSCFTYKGRSVDVKKIGRELGVRYVLEGSLRKTGSRIRVTAQLVEAESGRHVWAERYDRDLADIFAVQDEITEAVTIAIAPAIAEAEQQRAMRKPPENLDAWAAYQRGLWHLNKAESEDNALTQNFFQLAQKFFQQAIELDPSFAGGYTGLAIAQRQEGQFQGHVAETLSSAEALIRRAVALDRADAEARSLLANALWARGDYDGALAEAERALAMTPNLARAHHVLGTTLIFSGRTKEGIAALQRSIRLDPHHPHHRIVCTKWRLVIISPASTRLRWRQRNWRSGPILLFQTPTVGSLPRSASSVGPKRRRKHSRRRSRSRRPHSTCMSGASRGCGRRITSTCSRACARPGGKTEAACRGLRISYERPPRRSGADIAFVGGKRRQCLLSSSRRSSSIGTIE